MKLGLPSHNIALTQSRATARLVTCKVACGPSRRDLLTGMLVGTATLMGPISPPQAEARTVVGESIAGLWKNIQRQNGGVKILAPIRVAVERLAAADACLDAASTPDEFISVLKAVRAASVNCYLFEALPGDDFETRASLITQQFVTTADPCTFRIIVKNVTSLSSEETKKEGADLVESISNSFNLLDSYLEQGINGNSEKVDEARKQLKSTLALVQQLDKFVETAIMTDAVMQPRSS